MGRGCAVGGLAVFLSLALVAPCTAEQALAAVERVLGHEPDETTSLPFSRQFSVDGSVEGSLTRSTSAAGVSAAAMLEALRALAHTIDLDRDLKDGDRFHVRWRQTFTIDNRPIGVGRVLAVELRTAKKGTVAISRFRPFDRPLGGTERFFVTNGREAGGPPVRLPLDAVTITSGFGLRSDPLDQPQRAAPVVVAAADAEPPAAPPPRKVEDLKEIARAYAGFGGAQAGRASDVGGRNPELDRIMAERRVRAREEEEARKAADERAAAAPPPAEPASPRKPSLLFMHEGVDLLANPGTPVRAAADGMVFGAGPNRGYGNWIRLDHADGLSTVYAHMHRIAPGIEPGAIVARGDVIGFVGNTGRSTGAHLHFEVWSAGRPVDPQAAIRPRQLSAFDLARFRRQLAVEKAEREHIRAPVVVHKPLQQAAGD
jgi:murein DD-endopeptidase MepM/ murein hydrolase activator NlpD